MDRLPHGFGVFHLVSPSHGRLSWFHSIVDNDIELSMRVWECESPWRLGEILFLTHWLRRGEPVDTPRVSTRLASHEWCVKADPDSEALFSALASDCVTEWLARRDRSADYNTREAEKMALLSARHRERDHEARTRRSRRAGS